MGFFRKKKEQAEEKNKERLTVGQALRKERFRQGQESEEDVLSELLELCTQYEAAMETKAIAKQEYEAVLDYLADIGRIDEAREDQKAEAIAMAKQVIRLNDERLRFQNEDEKKLLGSRFLQMERYEKEVEGSLKTLKEQERYREAVERDMRNLEGEKGSLFYEKTEARRQLRFYKKLSFALVVMVCMIFILLMYLMQYFRVSLMLPILVTAACSLSLAAYILTMVRRLRHSLSVTEAKEGKLIRLTNKIKIKLVTCVNTIEFIYDKYEIGSEKELRYYWEQYLLLKKKRSDYKKNTVLLDQFSGALFETLRQIGVKDVETWLYQPEAIVDSREMVEVRHHCNERRRKIKERLDGAVSGQEAVLLELHKFVEAYEEHYPAIRAMLEQKEIMV